MARRIEHRSTFGWPAGRVYESWSDPEYWTQRLSAFDGNSELVEHVLLPDGLRLQVRQGVRAESIPSVARSVTGSGITINRREVWRREREGHYSGDVTAEVPGMPCAISGSLLLRDLPDGGDSEFVVDGTVRISVPLLGGKLERLFVDEIQQLLSAEDGFTADWLSRQR